MSVVYRQHHTVITHFRILVRCNTEFFRDKVHYIMQEVGRALARAAADLLVVQTCRNGNTVGFSVNYCGDRGIHACQVVYARRTKQFSVNAGTEGFGNGYDKQIGVKLEYTSEAFNPSKGKVSV